MRRLTVMLVLVMAAAGSRGAVDFSRYAPILERRPFSSPVAEVVDTPAPPVTAAAPPAFVQQLRMVAITESPAGVRAGFVSIREKPPKTYFLYVGDTSEDGILLAEADFDRERALLRKDGEQYWLAMGEASAPSPSAPVPGPPPRVSRGVQRPTVAAAEPAAAPGDGAKAISYADRRRQRLEEMRLRAQESRNLSEEEVEKRLREYQMKLIREGKTPLPIPITEEMDAQLVKEGILPAVE